MNDRPLDKVLNALRIVNRTAPTRNGKSWTAVCPAHDDRRPSLSVSEGDDGRALLHCHAGCTPGAIVTALGLSQRDLFHADSSDTDKKQRCRSERRDSSESKRQTSSQVFPTAREAVAALERQLGPHAACWTYHNAGGKPLGIVVRWNLPDGGKDIRPVSHNGAGWIIGAMPKPRPLYGLPELAEAQRVYIVEGEPAAEALRELGLSATTSAGGSKSANATDWSPLAGRECVIWPDADGPGASYAENVARLIGAYTPAATMKRIEPTGLPKGGDAVDFVAARRAEGMTDDAIRAAIEQFADAAIPIDLDDATTTGTPVLVKLSDVEPESIRWLWPQRVAIGKLTLLAGDPGLGKSFVTLDMAARVSTGTPWPDAHEAPNPGGSVVLLSAEDDLADTIRPRLDAAGADVTRIVAMHAVKVRDPDTGATTEHAFDLTADLRALETAIKQTHGCRLCIIDPLTAYLGPIDSHKNAEVRAALARLAELAARHDVAVVCVTHLNKASTLPAIYRAMGSLAFVAAARAVWAIARDKEDPTGRRRLLIPIKNNIAAEQNGLAYALQSADGAAVVVWEPDPIDLSADDALSADRPGDDAGSSALDEAAEWLRGVLADGPVLAKDVKRQAQRDAIAPRTLDRAKARLRVIAAPDGYRGPWAWRLPDESPERQSAPDSPECATPTALAHSGNVGALCDIDPDDEWGDI